ncbi:MAG: redoxin domain-containing protein [Thiothrix sp.]|nr:redoxin domain-containing protein [Thiothrix sp.]
MEVAEQAAKPVRKRRWRLLLLELLLLLVLILLVRGWQQQDLLSGEAADFRAMTLDGQFVSLADFRGQPLLLHFWASWCGVCEFEQPVISRVAQEWPVVTIATFDSGTGDEVRRYMERKEISHWTTLLDTDSELAGEYGTTGVPTTFVVDGEGVIRFREVGFTSSWGLRFRLWLAGILF